MTQVYGVEVGRGVATAANGTSVPYRIVRPSKTDLQWLGTEGARWQAAALRAATSGSYPAEVKARAVFADEVFAHVAANVLHGVGQALVAAGLTEPWLGHAMGTVGYFVNLPEPGQGVIALMAVHPDLIPGIGPADAALRGVGSALIAAASRELLRGGVTTVYLHPLDDAARTFWAGRGFQEDGAGRMSIKGVAAIQALVGRCEVQGEGPNEVVICGLPAQTRAYRLPMRWG